MTEPGRPHGSRPVVALDAMGGDFAPLATVRGAVQAAAAGERVVLVGDSGRLTAELDGLGGAPAGLTVVHAADVIAMGDDAARAVRSRRQSSIYVAMEVMKRGDAQAVVALGNTGAALATALVVLGRVAGVERPAMAAMLPTPGGPTLLLDAGANAENRPSHLVQFAHLGSAYMQTVAGVAEPRVGLLNIGEEPAKGSPLTVAVHRALSGAALRFIGNVEGGDVVGGMADVVVTDGFTGNMALKVLEGTATMLLRELRVGAGASLRGKLGGALLRPALRGVRERLDYRHYGGVPLLGVNGAVFIGHGRSDPHAVANAIHTAAEAVSGGMRDAIADAVRHSVGPSSGSTGGGGKSEGASEGAGRGS